MSKKVDEILKKYNVILTFKEDNTTTTSEESEYMAMPIRY